MPLLTLLFILSVFLLPASANADSIQTQRAQFIQAVDAFKKGDRATFMRLEKQLKNYVLYPYLRYMVLTQDLNKAPRAEIHQFITAYPDSHLSEKLQNQWLHILAQRQDWQSFLADYDKNSKNTAVNCLYRTALLKTGNTRAALADIATLWKMGRSLPPACNTAFTAWRQSGGLTNNLIWQRIRLAVAKNDTDLIKQLTIMLPAAQQPVIRRWIDILQAAKKDPEQALKAWQKLRNQYAFTDLQKGEVTRAIALGFATSADSRAAEWLSNVPHDAVDQTVREWRIRTALARNQWKQVRSHIKALPEKERNEPIWRYWLARAHQELREQPNEAQSLYASLTHKPDYYGFLASKRLNRPFVYRRTGEQASSQAVAAIANRQAFKRAYEFYQIKWTTIARQEWQAAIQDLTLPQLRAAGQLALKWHWYDRAIMTAVKAGLMDDIALRFPMAFQQHVIREAERYKIDPSWVFAIMRQESAFVHDAKSSAGAMGLMQVMPGTASWLAQKANEKPQSSADILRVDRNIHLGTRYLSQVLSNYRGNIILATASYNAGPNRIKRWLAVRPPIAADQWIETLPWHETRSYVKNVLAYTSIYDLHFGEQPDLDVYLERIS